VPVIPDATLEYVPIGIRAFGKGVFHYPPTLGGQLGSLRFFNVLPDRLVISNIKGWEGAIAVSSLAEAGCIASNRFLFYVPIDGRIDVSWARWYFLSEDGLENIQRASPGSADRNRTLAIGRFESLEIPLPPIDEQRRVAAQLDRLRFSSGELSAHAERAGQLSDALCVSATSRSDLNDRERKQDGWRRGTLAEVLRLNNDETRVDRGVSYDIAGVYSFGRGMFERTSLDGSQTSYKHLHRLHAGQLVMSRLKAWEGALALVPDELQDWFVSPEFPTFEIDAEQVDRRFLGTVVTSETFWSGLKAASQGVGARRERVNATRLLEQHLNLPPIDEQRRIAGVVDRLQAASSRRDEAKKRIGSLVPAALNRAFANLS